MVECLESRQRRAVTLRASPISLIVLGNTEMYKLFFLPPTIHRRQQRFSTLLLRFPLP